MTLTDTPRVDRDWLQVELATIVEEDGIDPDEDLTLYGLDSMGVMRLAMALEEQGIIVSFDDLIARPTLNAWAELVAGRQEPGKAQPRRVAPPST